MHEHPMAAKHDAMGLAALKTRPMARWWYYLMISSSKPYGERTWVEWKTSKESAASSTGGRRIQWWHNVCESGKLI